MNDVSFVEIEDLDLFAELIQKWRETLTFPNDDFWDAMMKRAKSFFIKRGKIVQGFASISGPGHLMNFYLLPEFLHEGAVIMQQFLKEKELSTAWLWANNQMFFSVAMQLQRSIEVEGFLFQDMFDTDIVNKEGDFRQAQPEDLDKLVEFSHKYLGAPKDWLKEYIIEWIEREEFFYLEKDGDLIGTCETRTTEVNPNVASLGIVVNANYRKQGYGTYLMQRAKKIAKERDHQPICVCDLANIGSMKAIQNCGFGVLHPIMNIQF